MPFWSHFGCLGMLLGLILALLGSLGSPFWPNWPKIAKKNEFLNLTSRFGTKLGPKMGAKLAQDPPKSRPKPKNIDVEKRCIFNIDFGRAQTSFWKGFWMVF